MHSGAVMEEYSYCIFKGSSWWWSETGFRYGEVALGHVDRDRRTRYIRQMGLGNRLNGKWVWPGEEETLRVKNNTESASVLLMDYRKDR